MAYYHNKSLTPSAKRLRKEMTKEERHLWYDFLSSYPIRFIRQKIIGNYIVDFYCAKAFLAIELDGSQHYEEKNIESDKIRTQHLSDKGIQVIRIPNNDVNRNFDGVCRYIDAIVKDRINLP